MKGIISCSRLHGLFCVFVASIFFSVLSASAQTIVQSSQKNDVVAVPSTLKTENSPPVLRSTQDEFNSYSKSYYLSSVVGVSNGGENRKPAILVKEINNPVQLMEYRFIDSAVRVETKLEIPASDTIYDLYPSPDSSLYLYNADDNGDGQYQFYIYNLKTKKTVQVTSNGRNVEPVWSGDGRRIAYGTAAPNQEGMSLTVADLGTEITSQNLAKTQIVATTNFMLTAQGWSRDGNFLAYIEYFSNRNSTALWLVNLKTNEKILVSPSKDKFQPLKIQTDKLKNLNSDLNSNIPNGEAIAAQFSPDGKKLYFAANHDGDFLRLYSYDLASRKTAAITERDGFDIEAFRLSSTGRKIAVVYDVDGASRLFVMNTDGSQIKEMTLPVAGVIENLAWSDDDKFLAFNIASAQLPAAIMYVDLEKEEKPQAEIVASSPAKTAETSKLPKAESISWKAEDGLLLKGWIFKPTQNAEQSKLNAKRPVIIDVHGGPEESARPEYPEEDAYYLNALGAAVIYPNVRGSTGRGKSFMDADNGLKRADAAKDFGRLFEWIAGQPDLDANRILLRGFSYGGYMALLVAATYPDRVSAVSVESAPTNLVSFLETTSGWRRAQRRNEYGDERIPKIRAGLEKTAPRNLVGNLRMPIFIAYGRRDPRVSATESEKFIAAVRSQGNKDVWSVSASDDGHGLTGENEYYRSLLAAEFFKKFAAGKKGEDPKTKLKQN